uniref:Capsid protein n=1 Tax=Cressdnaviricota sp. TaxID=2748378 RepID=A0A890ULJ2_9VIRU|nr:MAG: capsid protein [Cressdnaviricota sp.]
MPYQAKLVAAGLRTSTSGKRVVSPFSAEEYLHNLINPIRNMGTSKIPDLASYPTSVYSEQTEFTVDCNGSGVGGFAFWLYPAAKYSTETAATTDAAIVYTADINFSGNTDIQATFQRHRLVGFGFEYEYVGNDTNNQGQVGLSYVTGAEASKTTFDAILNSRDGVDGAAKWGGFGRYRPLDQADFDMHDTTSTSKIWAKIQVHFSACSAGAKFRVRATAHWEGITKLDNVAFTDLSDSPVNPLMLAAVQTVAQPFMSVGLYDVSKNQMDLDYQEALGMLRQLGGGPASK